MSSIADVIETSNEPGLFAIRPGACFLELGALLVEEYPLRMLKSSLMKPSIVMNFPKAWSEFESQLERTGLWLSVIHKNFNAGQPKPLAGLGIQEQLESEFEIIEKLLNKPLLSLRKQFQMTFLSLQTSEISLASLHNDFHLGNVFVLQDGRVGALDPNWIDRGSMYEDLSSLLIDPVTRKLQIMSLGLLFRPSMYKRYENAVLRGYYGKGIPPRRLINFYCALDTLVKWRMNEEILIAPGSSLRSIASALFAQVMRYYFERLIRNYLEKA
jgi:hypothetical protein